MEPGAVRLGQIAEIEGDSETVKKISEVEVGKVTEPGRKTRVTEKAIKGFFIKSVALNQDIIFDGAKFCEVVARSALLSSDSLKILLQKEVRSRMPKDLKEEKDWIFEAKSIPNKLPISEKNGKIIVSLSPRFSGKGQEMASVQIFNGNKMISKHSVPFIIKRFEDVAELKKSIRTGEVIGENDFEMRRQETTFQKRKIISKKEEALGRTAIRALRVGDILTENSLTAPYLVKEGDAVKIFVKFGEATVQTNAIAKRSAFKGQTISFKNMDSGKEILATVSGFGEAWVN